MALGAAQTTVEPTPAAAAPAPVGLALEDLPPAVRLGVRVEGVRRNWAVIPTVVIVRDEAAYIDAVSAWTYKGRYPVLLDDGTERAREDIARFVRGFKPQQVVRWSRDPAAAPFPPEPDKRRAQIDAALYRIWSAPLPGEAQAPKVSSTAELMARFKKLDVPIPGIIAADPADGAWTAALALAAGRCEPIDWVTVAQGVNEAMPRERFEALETSIEHACGESGLPWRAIGDEIDAVTLCLNCPVKVQLDGSNVVATTDLLARHPEKAADGKPGPRDKGERWAWAGQVFGTPAQAAYGAMSALFLMPRTAWVFDGYPDTKPWNQFSGAQAGKHLSDVGLETTVDSPPKGNEKGWRIRSQFGVDAGFIAVNSKGMADEFNLEPGQCRPGEVPFLKVPAILYMVHSWSAAAPVGRWTVAGRWMERGTYAMLGSTSEPYLAAFIPTPILTARVASAYPWGAAVRPDNLNPVWKLATIGDPLITLGPPAPRTEEKVPLPSATDLDAAMRDAVASHQFEDAIVALTLLGRDADAAKLAAALHRDQPAAFTPAIAAAALLPAFRARDVDLVLACYAQFSAKDAADPARRDVLWHACWLSVTTDPSEAMLQTLRTNLRPDQIGEDAAILARPMASKFGVAAALAMLNEALPRATTDYDRRQIDDSIKLLQRKR